MTAQAIALALGGRKCGARWLALCPAHDDHHASLSIRDGSTRVLVRCWAGCEQSEVIAALRGRGLWPESPQPNWTHGDRRAWARDRAADECDLPAARWFARAGAALAEEVLEGMDPCDCRRRGLTELLRGLRSEASLLSEYRAWRERQPELAAAMIEAGRASEAQGQREAARVLMEGITDAEAA